ncbi:heparinase II/III family protein [Hymenobacter sp.]|uniref:heparinase II/III domain-containing protein n=1 Tax=Hymenobacter sp. TaxID=1898978 RepID=UPI00286C5BA1|nr:heparinase II/III family protein [Hymenobacter sp.]
MRTYLFVVLLLLSGFTARAQPDYIGSAKLSGHPRLLLREGEEAAIRQTIATDTTWAAVHRAILRECDSLTRVAPVQRALVGRRLLTVSRECLRRVFFLAYAYRLTQDKRYAERAEREMLAAAAFRDWNPEHFLDVAEMTLALAIGYDWLYKQLPPASRLAIGEALLTKGLVPSLGPPGDPNWLTATHNWNQVCNAGMTYGALALYDEHPEVAKKIINRAINTIELPMREYAPDGAYPEGYTYWDYGTSFNVLLVAALEKAFGRDFGLTAQPGFLKTAAYVTHMSGPTGAAFNYSDSGPGGSLHPALFWFAHRTNDASLLWGEQHRLARHRDKKFVAHRLLPALVLWNGGVRLNALSPPKALLWTGGGSNPVALMRTSWTDPRAIFVGLKGGSPSVNHGHMDVGSFVMEADGVRWAMDFGPEDYSSLEAKGLDIWGKGQDAQRWQVYRHTNRAHSTLTVDDGLQLVDGYAPITRAAAAPGFMRATTDLTSLYNNTLAQANRGVAIVDGRYVVVRDELRAANKATTVRWAMLTPASVKLVGKNRAELTKDGKKLILQVREPATITLQTWATDPPQDYDAPNPGTTLVGFDLTLPPGAKRTLSVLLLPEKAAQSGKFHTPALTNY